VGIDSVSLIGQGQWVKGSQWPVMESTVIIRCIRPFTGLQARIAHKVTLKYLTITNNCSLGLYIDRVQFTQLSFVSFQHLIDGGFYYNGSVDSALLTISNSSFHHNCFNTSTASFCTVTLYNYDKLITCDISNSSFSSNLRISLNITNYQLSNKNGTIMLKITDCLFFNNTGLTSGGISILSNSISFVMSDTKFINNTATRNQSYYTSAGAISMFASSSVIAPIFISNCIFIGNKGVETGAFYIDLGHDESDYSMYIYQSIFIGNSGTRGSAISIASHAAIIVFSDVLIASNTYDSQLPPNQYSALYIQCYYTGQGVILFNNITLCNNDMTGVVSKGCLLTFKNKFNYFINNRSPLDGGAIWVDDSSLLTSDNPQGIAIFSNNTATRYGGALYSTANAFQYPKKL
jgi:predicted outer membrane repeat protein